MQLVFGLIIILGVGMFVSFFVFIMDESFGTFLLFTIILFLFLGSISLTSTAKVGSPIVEETRYEILGGSDTTRVSGSISGNIFYVTGSVSEDSFFKIYYPGVNSDGEEIAIPFTVKENQVEIVILPDDTDSEYLLQITTKQWYEYDFKNKILTIEEPWCKTESVRYKLYVRQDTFNNKITIDGNK